MNSEFAGGVFSATLPDGRGGARVSLDYDAVRATTTEGATFAIPYASLELELGGASGKMWFCRTPDRTLTIFCEAPGFREALGERARRELGAQIERIETQRATERRHTAKWVALLVVLPALLLVAGYFGLRRAGRSAVELLPPSVDEQLGELAIENMDLGGTVVRDPLFERTLATLLARLSPHANKQFELRVRVVDSPTVNAFALPGGHIVVYTGLLRTAEKPEQVAGVLAHEIAHVTLRHGMHRIAQSIGIVAAIQLLFGDVSGVFAVAVELLRQGAINSYSRDQERDADREGVRTMAAAQLDPGALADFFALLDKRAGRLERAAAWLGTHPDLSERIAAVRRMRADAKVTPKPLDIDWANVQARAGKSALDEPPAQKEQ